MQGAPRARRRLRTVGRCFLGAPAAAALLFAAGCSGGPEGGTLFPVDRGSEVDAVELEVVVGADGGALMTVSTTFAGGDATDLPVPAGGEPVGEPVLDGDRTSVTYALRDVADVSGDLAVLQLPTYTSPPDATRQDPQVAVTGTVVLDAATDLTSPVRAQWTNGLDADVRVDGATISFGGEVPAWTDSELLVAAPPSALPGVAPGPTSGTGAFESAVAQSEAQTASLQSTLDSQELQARWIGWAIMAVGVGLSVFMVFQLVRVNTVEVRERRRRARTFPRYQVEPPDDLPPALVDLVDADGRRVEAEAVAGTLLDLVHRRVLALDGQADGRFVLHVPPPSDWPASSARSERILLEGLRAEHPDGRVEGPPTWGAGTPGWWASYRRAVLQEGRDRGLVERRFRLLYVGSFVAGIVAGTWPWWAGERLWLVPTLCIALGLVTFVPLRGALTTTEQGFAAACRWRGFARYVHDHGELADRDVAAVHVWGPYLAQSVVLGEAPRAARDLAPDGVPERASRADRRAAAEELPDGVEADDGPVGPLTPPVAPSGE